MLTCTTFLRTFIVSLFVGHCKIDEIEDYFYYYFQKSCKFTDQHVISKASIKTLLVRRNNSYKYIFMQCMHKIHNAFIECINRFNSIKINAFICNVSWFFENSRHKRRLWLHSFKQQHRRKIC